MIVTCPSCDARYRIRDDKIEGKGARITCPNCGHKFVVYVEEQFVVGDKPSKPRGLPVTIHKKGQDHRAEGFEDDEDAPTTLMPHGSALNAELRNALLATAEKAERDPRPPASPQETPAQHRATAPDRAAAPPRAAAGGGAGPSRSLRGGGPSAQGAGGRPPMPRPAPAQGGNRSLGAVLAVVFALVGVLFGLYAAGLIP